MRAEIGGVLVEVTPDGHLRLEPPDEGLMAELVALLQIRWPENGCLVVEKFARARGRLIEPCGERDIRATSEGPR